MVDLFNIPVSEHAVREIDGEAVFVMRLDVDSFVITSLVATFENQPPKYCDVEPYSGNEFMATFVHPCTNTYYSISGQVLNGVLGAKPLHQESLELQSTRK